MKRRALFILLLLAAGAIVNVAVAWGLAAKRTALPLIKVEPPIESQVREVWDRYGSDELPPPLVALGGRMVNDSPDGGRHHRGGPRRSECRGADVLVISLTSIDINAGSGDGVVNDWEVVRLRTGWPALAMQGGSLWSLASNSFIVTDGLTIPTAATLSGAKDQRLLPLRPIWPGFAINTVFYAAVLWLLFAAPFALRRRRRMKRGLCPKCAYPVGTNDVCTECGAAVQSTLQRTAVNG